MVRPKYLAISCIVDSLEIDLCQWITHHAPEMSVTEACKIRSAIIRKAECVLIKLTFEELLKIGPGVMELLGDVEADLVRMIGRDVLKEISTHWVC